MTTVADSPTFLQEHRIAMSLSAREHLVLRGALGLDEEGNGSREREEIAFAKGSEDERLCQGLVTRGLLAPAPGSELFPDFKVFRVTPAGRKLMADSNGRKGAEGDCEVRQ